MFTGIHQHSVPYLGRPWLCLICLALLGALQGCASVYKPHNDRITQIDYRSGYRLGASRDGDFGDHLVILAFSGGGTRAAALSYGILKELRDTQVNARGRRVRLLDEVDNISSVSGGSFTAAYYGLFRDKLFTDYEKVFLRQSIQGTLIRKLFNPVYWWDSIFSGFDRTEMAVNYYDSHIFKGRTFADFHPNTGPFIEINATDLGGGNRFSFIQASFDLICSNLDEFSVARAVTASSAVPVAFPSVVLKNYAGDCDFNQSRMVKYFDPRHENNPRMRELQHRVKSYLDRQSRPYIHLVDGGISDNLGLRALIDRIETQGSNYFFKESPTMPKDVLVISVNAEVKPEHGVDRSADKPSVVETIDAMSDTQMSLYNEETKLVLENKLKELRDEVNARGHNVRFHMAEVSFSSVQSKTLKTYLNNLPTSLELSNQDVDMLIEAASTLLRTEPGYKAFLEANAGQRINSMSASPVARAP